MFNQTIHVKAPLGLSVRISRVGGDCYPVVYDDDGFTLIFEDMETLNTFAQAMHGLAQKARLEEEIYQEKNAPTGA